MSATFLLVIKRIYIRMRVGGKGSLWLVLVICFPIMHRGSLSGWQSSWGTHSGKNLRLRPPPACVLALCCFQQRQRSPVCVVNNKTPAIKRVTMFTHYDYVFGLNPFILNELSTHPYNMDHTRTLCDASHSEHCVCSRARDTIKYPDTAKCASVSRPANSQLCSQGSCGSNLAYFPLGGTEIWTTQAQNKQWCYQYTIYR